MIYLFSSANSLNSILTIDKKSKEGGSDSIFQLAKENNIDQVFLIEKNPSSFPQALSNATELGLQLVYGLSLTVCEDSDDKELESISTEHKMVFIAKTGEAYKNILMKLYSDAATRGNYNGLPRTDFDRIKEFWGEDMLMMVPFYDNFLHKNLFSFGNCLVKFHEYNPTFCVEYHELPLDRMMAIKIKEYCKENNYDYINSHSVRYKSEEDIDAYLTYRCIQNKSSIQCPNLEGFSSNKFSLIHG